MEAEIMAFFSKIFRIKSKTELLHLVIATMLAVGVGLSLNNRLYFVADIGSMQKEDD
jgi:hypothetical protein